MLSAPSPHRRAGRIALVAVATMSFAPYTAARATGGHAPAHAAGAREIPEVHVRADRALIPAALARAFAARAIPSFSRQTGLACGACHYQFPQLTPFGRLFKLNGYTLTSLKTIGAPRDTAGRETLRLAPFPPASAMLVGSLTQSSKAQPGTQNGTVSFPQQFSLFLSGEISSHIGAFTQFTYTDADAHFGVDAIDVRAATHHAVGGHDLLLGVTVHNNPTVQDVWNTVPAWTFPFMSSSVAPSPAASPLIDGALGQQVLGVGAYSMWNNLLYTELSAYRSAPQATHLPLDATATSTIRGVSPYWRVALQHQFSAAYAEVGTYGMSARLFPTGVTGPTDRFTDVAVDAQFEARVGSGMLIGRGSYIYEDQSFAASATAEPPVAESETGTLRSLRASVSYQPTLRYGLTTGWFQTSGSTDTLRFAPGALDGSATGRPDTSGLLGELAVNPWENTRLALQYVAYQKFNGSSRGYDGAGRRAANNDSLYLYFWIAF